MLDGGVLAGYLAVAATRATGRVFDKAVDALFDRLAGYVAQRLGWQAVQAITDNPGDRQHQRQVGQSIESVARVDAHFATELSRLQDRLDRLVGRQMINVVHAQTSVQSFGSGNAYGGHHYEYRVPDPTDYSSAPAWVKVLTAAGLGIALLGFGIAFLSIISVMGSGGGAGGTPDFGAIARGFALFFVGVVVLAVANAGKAMSRKR